MESQTARVNGINHSASNLKTLGIPQRSFIAQEI
jgi:hypothetical protein